MSYQMSCRRSIPAFTLVLLLILPSAAAAGPARGGDREPDERGRLSVVLESLWQWLGLAPGGPVPMAGANSTESGSENDTGTGGEAQGGSDPTGTGTPPPEYDPDLNPGGSGGG